MAATLTEPNVLAAAKETLYPDLDTSPDHYAVTETQFTNGADGKSLKNYAIVLRLTIRFDSRAKNLISSASGCLLSKSRTLTPQQHRSL
jgi:hypothetical protein